MPSKSRPEVALVHDYLTQRGGAERVVLDLAAAFPGAPLFTSLFELTLTFPEFQQCAVTASPLNHLSLLRHHHRLALPLYAPLFSTMKVDADVTICSSSGWAHGVTATGAKIVYCHAPARWLYQRERYLADAGLAQRASLALLSPLLKRWDKKAAQSATSYVVNSTTTQHMVKEAYGIEADIVHPPVSLAVSGDQRPVDGLEPGFLLVVARLLAYKNVQLTIAAAATSGHRVVVVGDGPLRRQLEHEASPSVTFLGTVDDSTLRWCYANCAAHVAMSYEDYGLSPIEAAAFGKPTIALGAGGYLDTVISGETGLHVAAPTVEALGDALSEFSHLKLSPSMIIAHARTFSKENFIIAMQQKVAEVLA